MNVRRSAVISRDGRYRYVLRRQGDALRPRVLVIGLSTADAHSDDPTIRRCIQFARRWGFGELVVGNLFAYRTPHPRALWQAGSASHAIRSTFARP